jgi:hypothetical protein
VKVEVISNSKNKKKTQKHKNKKSIKTYK